MSYPTKDPTPVQPPKLGDGPYDPILPPPPGGYPPTEPAPLAEGQYPGVNSNSVTKGNKGGNKNSWKGKGGNNKKPVYKFTHVTADCGDGIEAYFPLVLNPLDQYSFVFDPTPPAVCTWKDLTIYNDVQTIAESGFADVNTDGSINFLASNLTIGDRAFKNYGQNSTFLEYELVGYKFGESSFEFCGINNGLALVDPDISEAPRCFFGYLSDRESNMFLIDFGNRVPVGFASSSKIAGLLLQNDKDDYLIAGSAFSSALKLKQVNFDENCVVIGENAFKTSNISEPLFFSAKTAVFGNDCFRDSIEGAELWLSPDLQANTLQYIGNGFLPNIRAFYPGSFRGSRFTQEVLDLGCNNATTRICANSFSECKAEDTQFSTSSPGNRVNIAPGAFSSSDFRNFYLVGGHIEVEHKAFDSCNTYNYDVDVAFEFDTFTIHDFAFQNMNKEFRKPTGFKFPGLSDKGSFVGIKTFQQTDLANNVAWNSKADGELLAYSLLPSVGVFRNPAFNQGFHNTWIDTSSDEKNTVVNEFEGDLIPCVFSDTVQPFILSDDPPFEEVTAFCYDHVAHMNQFGGNGIWWSDSQGSVVVMLPDGRQVTLEQVETIIGGSTVKDYSYLWEETTEDFFNNFVQLDYILSTDEFWNTAFLEGQNGPNPTTVQPFGGTDTLNTPGGWVLTFSITMDPIEPGDPMFSSPQTVAGYKWHREGNPKTIIPFGEWQTYITPETRWSDLEPPYLFDAQYSEDQHIGNRSVSWDRFTDDLSKVETDIEFEDYDDARDFKRKHLICGTVNGL